MVDHNNDICQLHSRQETPEDDLWRSYNSLLLGRDYSRIRKLLVRYRLFEMSLDVPGDIIECGVFKGTGLMYWAKLLEIFAPNSRKRVIGFDVFGPFKQVVLQVEEINIASRHDQIAKHISMSEIAALVDSAGLSHRVELIEGDITQTSYIYVVGHYGLRISLLHLDLDTYAGTKAALTAFWPIVSRGGVIIFDEYGVKDMGESQAVDEFFQHMNIRPHAVEYSDTPTAYVLKP
jgi:Macrocin-O-methyltransferase (TylF)